MNRILKFTTAAALFFLSCISYAEDLKTYPAGAKLIFDAKSEIRFKLAANAPSIFWLKAESRSLKSIQIKSREYESVLDDIKLVGECIIPLYTSGDVEVLLKCRAPFSENVVVTSYYGIGEIVDTYIEAPAISLNKNETTKDSVSENKDNSAADRETNSTIVPVINISSKESSTVSTPTVSSVQPVDAVIPAASITPVAAPIPAPVTQVSQPKLEHSEDMIRLIPGEWITGKFKSNSDVITYRVYIPNRQGFSLQIVGECDVRIQSQNNSFDKFEQVKVSPYQIKIPSPTDGTYFISLKGQGNYAVRVEVSE